MQGPEVILLARAIRIRNELAAGRFHGANCRFAANFVSAWLESAKDRLECERLFAEEGVPRILDDFEDEAPDEEVVFWIERIYKEIEHRLNAH
jgi:hypothetical protein